MAGHSKWSKVKRFKGAIDGKRDKIFSKLSREISLAAKAGDRDPGGNPLLRSAIQAARDRSMPNDNIERAIEYIDSDEYVEATPKSLRLQTHSGRERAKAGGIKRSLGTPEKRLSHNCRIIEADGKNYDCRVGSGGSFRLCPPGQGQPPSQPAAN
jgi:hypothetical protein